MPNRSRTARALAVACCCLAPGALLSQESAPPPEIVAEPAVDVAEEARELELDFGIEAKFHYRDSEGLLLLTDDGRLQARISNPRFKTPKTYLVQVEGDVTPDALARLRAGVMLKDGPTLPAQAERIETPALWPRDPPVRFRKTVPDCWISLTIHEGRNRQVRRMTAAVGHPTLRLVRWRIGDWTLDGVAPGTWRDISI